MAKIKLFKFGEFWYCYSRMDYFNYFYKACEDRYSDDLVYQKIEKDEVMVAWEKAQWLFPTKDREYIAMILKNS